MKFNLLIFWFFLSFTSCRTMEGKKAGSESLKSSTPGESDSDCEMFPDYYQLGSCEPVLPGQLPNWVGESKYMSEERFFALIPFSYKFVQNNCESVNLTYPKRIQRRKGNATSEDRTCSYWPDQSLKLGVENVVQSGELRFVGRWLGKKRLEIIRSENIGIGEVTIADTFAKGDDGWFTMTRELTFGSPNNLGMSPMPLMKCVYRGWRQAPYPSNEPKVFGPPCEAPSPAPIKSE